MAGLDVDEAAMLKAYRLDSLEPASWQDVDYEVDGPLSPGTAVAGTPGPMVDEPDALGLRSQMPSSRELAKETRAQISLSSKAFDPKVFLSTIHPDATFADLARGVAHLKESIDMRSEALKVLVEDNFDRFVAVKATTDGVHREMRESEGGPLRDDADYGVKELKEILAQASAKADQVFMPVLENNLKAIKLRSTLGVFERSKFFFNLPGSLGESVEAGRFDLALRDYKKGKFLLESRPGQLLAFNTAAGQAGSTDPKAVGNAKQQAQQRRVFAKVWDAVEDTMQDMQQRLFALLREPRRGVEEQEKTIEILLELNPHQDPVAVFLESQHQHIRSLMRKSYDTAVARIDAARVAHDVVPQNEKALARDMQTCVRLLNRSELSFDRALGAPTWKAIVELVRNLSETIVQTLPSFWKVAKHHMDGKFQKGKPTDASSQSERIYAQSRAWASESVDTLISLLSHYFTLTDIDVLVRQPLSPLPDWVPRHTCSATAAYYMQSALTELAEAVNDIDALSISSRTAANLRNLLANTRFRFTEVLCRLWEADAKLFFMLEDWTLNPDEQATTLYMKDLALFHKSNARAAYHIAGGKDVESNSGRSKEPMVSVDFTNRIKAAFLDALYAFLDGLVHLAFSEYDPLDPALTTSQKVVADSKLTVDVRELDTRILLTVTNLAHLNRTIIPSLVKQFQEAYQSNMTEDLKTLDEVAQQLDGILFTDFIKRKGDTVSAIIRGGILESGINWLNIPKPSEVHPFIYEALLSLVQVHAQVRAVAKPLVQRTLTALLDDLARETLDSFGQIDRFGVGGMLQATLEIEFMHQTLSQYVSPSSEATLKSVYETISQKYSRTAAAGGGGGQAGEAENLKRELEAVKRTLVASRKATALEFLCFRRARPKEEKEKGQGQGQGQEKGLEKERPRSEKS